MTSEAKIKANELIIHLLGAWYSFCLIVLSVAQATKTYDIPQSNLLSIALSIALFALSFFVYGEKYHEKSSSFRLCYLELQELYRSNITIDKKMAKYAEILKQYPNHDESDYDDMLFDAWIRNQSLENSNESISITLTSGAKVIFRRALRLALYALLFTAPVIIAVKFAHPTIAEQAAKK